MNQDVIDELVTHAEFYVGNEHSDKSAEEQQRLFVDRLIELTVYECTGICERKMDHLNHHLRDVWRGALICRADIRTHFGIDDSR